MWLKRGGRKWRFLCSTVLQNDDLLLLLLGVTCVLVRRGMNLAALQSGLKEYAEKQRRWSNVLYMEPLGGTLLKMSEFGRNGLWIVLAWTAMATIYMTTILFVLQTSWYISLPSAVAFAYIEEYRPSPTPQTKRWCGRNTYRCVFDDNENAVVWTWPKGMEISKILGWIFSDKFEINYFC